MTEEEFDRQKLLEESAKRWIAQQEARGGEVPVSMQNQADAENFIDTAKQRANSIWDKIKSLAPNSNYKDPAQEVNKFINHGRVQQPALPPSSQIPSNIEQSPEDQQRQIGIDALKNQIENINRGQFEKLKRR